MKNIVKDKSIAVYLCQNPQSDLLARVVNMTQEQTPVVITFTSEACEEFAHPIILGCFDDDCGLFKGNAGAAMLEAFQRNNYDVWEFSDRNEALDFFAYHYRSEAAQKAVDIEKSAREWLKTIPNVPWRICEILEDEIHEITPLGVGSSVYIHDGKRRGDYAVIQKIEKDEDGTTYCTVKIVGEDTVLRKNADEITLDAEFGTKLPAYMDMWTFEHDDGESIYWLENEGGLQKMADLGFRIYEQDDYRYLFGADAVDGGLSFDEYWLPLYKARFNIK